MSESKHSHGVDKLVTAYERMLGRIHDAVDQADKVAIPALRERLSKARDQMVELGELTREEAHKVSEYIERDIHDAAHYIAETGEDLGRWWRFDLEQIERRLLDTFARVADQTSVELQGWAERARRAEPYRQGEVAAPGALICTECGAVLTLTETARIPACPQCGAGSFTRVGRG